MTTENKLFETYLKFKPKQSRCILEQVVLWADRLDEASIGSLYKASVFLGPDDMKFLQQFPRKWWVSALFQRYNNHESGFKSLWNYLVDLHKMREPVIQREFPKIYEQEMEHFHKNPYYSTMDKSLLNKLAYDHARVGASREAYRLVPADKYPPPDGDQDFIFRDGTKNPEVYRANPMIGELVKKIEGTFDNEDGFDLSNPTRKVVKDIDPETGKEVESVKSHTDGFNFPNLRVIRNLIQEYLKYIGHGIIRLEDSELEGAELRPDKEAGRNPKGSEDTLTKEMIVRDLKKQYKISDKEANERFLELVRQGSVKGINNSDLNEKGVGPLLLPHKKQKIRRVINGEIVMEETDNPVLDAGHFVRRLKKEEADAVERVLRNDDPSEEDQRIFNSIEQRIRGWHYDVTTEPQGTDESGKPLPGRSRPIYIDSSHEGGSHRQGSDHIAVGGWNPNQETDGRKFLTKYGTNQQERYENKINKLFRLYLTDDNGNYLRDDAGNLIANPDADNDGSQLRKELEKRIDRKLALADEFRATSALHRGNNAPERLVMASARNLIVQSAFKRIIERLGDPNIELHNALGRSIRAGIVESELSDLSQQNIAGRGSRRRRGKEQKGAIYPITNISDLSQWSQYVGCDTDQDFRKMGSSRCAFSYDLDKLVDRTKYLSGDINAIAKNVNTSHEITADDIQAQIFKMRDSFSEAFAHLEQSFYVKLMAENQTKTDRQIDQSVIDSVKRKTYGPSGDGTDGDFSGFENPDAAKNYFMKHFSRQAVDDKHFSHYIQTYRHSDIQVTDELSVMQTAKNMTMEFLSELYEKYMPKDSFNYNASLIGHITHKIESNVAEASKLLNMEPEASAEQPQTTKPEQEGDAEPIVGLSMINDLKNQLENNPLNYEMIARQAVETIGKRYPDEMPVQIKTLIDKTKSKIQNAIYKADAAIRNKTFVHINNDLLKLLPTDKLEVLMQAADEYQQIKKFGILKNIIEKMRDELKQR